jgi:hypothetical protein
MSEKRDTATGDGTYPSNHGQQLQVNLTGLNLKTSFGYWLKQLEVILPSMSTKRKPTNPDV